MAYIARTVNSIIRKISIIGIAMGKFVKPFKLLMTL